MHKFPVAAFCLILSLGAVAQNPAKGTVVLKVLSAEKVPLPHTTVELLRGKDSSLVKAQMTDSLGQAAFYLLPANAW